MGTLWRVPLFFLFIAKAGGFVLEGSPTSYAHFNKWYMGVNGTLSFDFRAEEPKGLLFYSDDGGISDFFELKLVEGSLRLRFNLGGGAVLLTSGNRLHDGAWHHVEVTRNGEETLLRVDDDIQSQVSRGIEYIFGNHSSNSDLYFGGLPAWYNSNLSYLSLPSVLYEPHFKGAIRNVIFAHEEGMPKRQEMIHSQGVRATVLASCEHHDPCQHGGLCISTDTGPVCNCNHVDYDGNYCEKNKSPSEATFRGSEFLSYDLRSGGEQSIISSSDEVSIFFKTRQPNGLMFYTNDGEDFMGLLLRDGGVVLVIRLGSGSVERTVRPARVRFDDNQWHKVLVHRKVREITRATSFCHLSITVDGVYTQRGSTAGAFSLLSSAQIYIGGYDAASTLAIGRTSTNFVGCLRKVQFVADSLSLDLIELANTDSKLVRPHGNLQFMCQEVEAADPITFTTRDSFLALPCWEATRTGSLSFKIRTNEANGVLMYNSGATSQGDFFAFELLAGHVYLLLNLGSGAVKVKATTTRRVDDGNWHTVSLRRNGKSGRVTVDESAVDFITPGNSNQLDLEGPLYLGGIGTSSEELSLPVELWAGRLQYGYVGCVRDLVVNDHVVDIADFAKKQDSGSIRPACHPTFGLCDSQPCLNGGFCEEGWNRFVCDCSRTGFDGPICAKDATTLSFDGEQYMAIDLPEISRTQAEDVQLRFRTTRPSGLLLITSVKKSTSYMMIALESGRVMFILNLGDGNKIVHLNQGLNDDQWHTVQIIRRGRSIVIMVDSEVKNTELLGHKITLEFQKMHIGAEERTLKLHKDVPNFVGHMQHLEFNGFRYFEMAQTRQLPNFQVTAKFGNKEHIVHRPVTFKSKLTYVGLPQLKAYSTMNLYFQFKTSDPSGLILYNGGKEQDFIAIELVNGHLHYIFNMGDGPRKVRSNTRRTLNDNKWHAVTIGRLTLHQHTLMVDDMIATVTSMGSNVHLDLDGLLYLGGVQESMYEKLPKIVLSKYGFTGCIASLDLNGETLDPSSDALIPSTLVSKGCAGPERKCSSSACANHGVCVQLWNSYTCDCDMTSFTGPTCSDESIAYRFGGDSSLMTYTFTQDKRPDTKTDLLALGFITTKDNAVLVRIDSGSSNDYMELEIVEGNIFVVYNMGTEDHPIGELSMRVDDGQYHVVRFTRAGPNSTLQLDNHNVLTKYPEGRQLTVFNSHSKAQIGGKKNPVGGKIERSFQGILAGLVFNGHRLLDLGAENDPRITIEGDVELLVSIPFDSNQKFGFHAQMQQPRSKISFEGDDLVFPASESGCFDDEDDCGVIEFGSGDDLITPVYISPTSEPHPTTSTTHPQWPGALTPVVEETICDDEEDCTEGSGFDAIIVTSDSSRIVSEIVVPVFRAPVQPYPISPTISQQEGNVSDKVERSTTAVPTSSGNQITQHPPSVYQVPIPEMPKNKELPKLNQKPKSSADNTALVIGIIAGLLILIVLIALVLYRLRNRTDGSYKIDESKNYEFPAVANSPALISEQQMHVNGTIKTTEKLQKKEDIKDLREWYV
ncbi:neurexin 1-like isoform X2 [Tachypleus tridentatus]|uniref:neurexin 1-like isoform X2 n=1 Tax=Tachypleus tridentatus TaxID=6853 RepID=UPI003FCF034A